MNPIRVQVQDYYSRALTIDNSTKIELSSATVAIQGASTLTVVKGEAVFDEVVMLSDPGRLNETVEVTIQQFNNALVAKAYRLQD